MKEYASGNVTPYSLIVNTIQMWVVSFTPWPLYSSGYPLTRRDGRPHRSSGCFKEENLMGPCWELNLLSHPACSLHTLNYHIFQFTFSSYLQVMNTFSVLSVGNNLLPIFITNAYAWQCQHVYGQCCLQGEFNVSLSITTKHTYIYML